jgi:hypothetical protein
MSYLSRSMPPHDRSHLMLRDVASLFITSELISSSLVALRPECEFSKELTTLLDAIVVLCDSSETKLHQPLLETGAVLPTISDSSASTLIAGFFTRLPATVEPKAFAAEVAVNLQLLAQHVELKAKVVAEEALHCGLDNLSKALSAFSTEWRDCGRKIRKATFHPETRENNHDAFHFSSGVIALPQGA